MNILVILGNAVDWFFAHIWVISFISAALVIAFNFYDMRKNRNKSSEDYLIVIAFGLVPVVNTIMVIGFIFMNGWSTGINLIADYRIRLYKTQDDAKAVMNKLSQRN